MHGTTLRATDAGGRVLSANTSKDPSGRTTARIAMDLPQANSAIVLEALRSQGEVSAGRSATNTQVPLGQFARTRIDVMFSTPDAIVGADAGVWATVRSSLATSAAGLMWSLRLIVIGLCLVVGRSCCGAGGKLRDD